MTGKRIVVLLILLSACIWPSENLYSADFDSGLKEINRPVREDLANKLDYKRKPPTAVIEEGAEPPIKGGKPFFVKEIQLIGCEIMTREDFADIIAKYESREVTLEELYALGKEIETAYIEKGLISACFVPPQDVKGGVVILQIVEARMGKLKIDSGRYFSKKKIAGYWTIPRGDILRYDKISRTLQLINKNPDREAKATLVAGEEPGFTDVIMNVPTHLPLHFTYSFDREGAVSTGRERSTYGFRHNNFLGLDDTFMAGVTTTDHSGSFYMFHMLPLNSVGTYMINGYSRSEAFPKKDFEGFDLRSYSEGMSFSIHQDVFQKEVYFGDVYMIMDGGDKEIYTNNGLNTKDRLRVMRFGGNMLIRAPKTGISIKPEFAQGLDFLGARKSNEYSSRGADCVFSKFGLSFREKIYLPYDMTLELKSSMQVAGSKLTPQEQMSLGGMYSVRGYPYGDYYADNAVQSTVELLVPPAFLPDSFKLPGSKDPLKKNIQGLLFFDHGYGVKRGANEGEKNEQKLASCGTGMRIRVYDQLYVRLEWGFILPMGDKSLTESADSHFHVLIDFEDKFLDHLAGKITVPSPPAH